MGRKDIDIYLQHLQTLPFVHDVSALDESPSSHGRPTIDGILALELADGEEVQLAYEVKTSHLAADVATYLSAPATPNDQPWILLAPYVGAPTGDALQARGINFIDRVGNCHLQLGTRHVARIQGRPAPKPPARAKELRAAGYQVMFAWLTDPDLVARSQRDVAAAAGTSRQPVVDLFARFVEEGLLVRDKRRHRWVNGPDGALLERWLAGYRATLRPKLFVGRFRVPAPTPTDVEAWLDDRLEEVRYGGTAGAFRLVDHYRGAQTVVHLGPPSEDIRRRIKALPSADGDLVWLRHIGRQSLDGPTPDTVHPLVIYAELMFDRDPRANETAAMIRQRYLQWSL